MAKRNSAKARDLIVWLDNKPIALSTNCTLNISRAMNEVGQSKDDDDWRRVYPGVISWSVSVDSLFSPELEDADDQLVFNNIFLSLVEGKELTLTFTMVDNPSIVGLPTDGWTPKSKGGYTGKCFVDTNSLSAGMEGDASSSFSFTGNGPIDPQK